MASPPTVDVHAHLMPTELFDELPEGLRAHRDPERDQIALAVSGRGGAVGRGAPVELRELEAHRAIQARRGAMVSLLGPWVDMIAAPVDAPTQVELCRVVNRELGRACRDRGDAYFLAALPDRDGGAAAEVLEEALEGGAAGGMLAANTGEGTLSRPDLDALWATAERRSAPLVLHPGHFAPPPGMDEYFLVNLVGNPSETTLAVGSLLGAEVPERFGDLQLVLVHGGGFFPYQYGRMSAGFGRWPGLREYGGRPPEEYLRWFHYDTVLFDDRPTRYLLDLVGDDRVLAGSDCPFTMTDERPFVAPSGLGLDPGATERVLGGNAVTLFRLPIHRDIEEDSNAASKVS